MTDAPCPYERHELDYWRRPGGPLTCGICHPIPGIVCTRRDTRETGFWGNDRNWNPVEYVLGIPSAPRPTVASPPTRRSTMERLTRPRTREEAQAFARSLGDALERLGVERGAEFIVTAVTPDTPGVTEAEAGTLFEGGQKPGPISALTQGDG